MRMHIKIFHQLDIHYRVYKNCEICIMYEWLKKSCVVNSLCAPKYCEAMLQFCEAFWSVCREGL